MLNCETCTQTQHHCCKASIALNVMDVIVLINKAKSLNIDIKVLPSKDKPDYFNIIKKGKPFKSLNDENCAFLNNGACIIYNDRPNICKVYGTEQVKCWFHEIDYDTSSDKIFNISTNEINLLTQTIMQLNESSVIKIFKEKMK